MSGKSGKGLFKACGWKLQSLIILHLLSEQNEGMMDRVGLKQKNTYLFDLTNVPSDLSTSIHMGSQYCLHARLLTVSSRLVLKLLMSVSMKA